MSIARTMSIACTNCTLGSTMLHHNLLIILLCLSTHISPLPVRSSAHCHARRQPYLNSTQTYIHLNKLLPAYITSTARSRHSPTHLSLLTATLLLCGGYPTQSRSHPPCKPPHLHHQHKDNKINSTAEVV